MPDIDKTSASKTPAKPVAKDVTKQVSPVKPSFATHKVTGQVRRYFPKDEPDLTGTRPATRKEIALAGY